jgi:hypothetical protein
MQDAPQSPSPQSRDVAQPQSRDVAQGWKQASWWEDQKWKDPQSQKSDWSQGYSSGSSEWQEHSKSESVGWHNAVPRDSPALEAGSVGQQLQQWWNVTGGVHSPPREAYPGATPRQAIGKGPAEGWTKGGKFDKDGGLSQSQNELPPQSRNNKGSGKDDQKAQGKQTKGVHMKASQIPAVAEPSVAAGSASSGSKFRSLNKQFFDDFTDFTSTWEQHNAAAKFFRQQLVFCNEVRREFRGDWPIKVGHIVHEDKSPNFTIDYDQMKPWYWFELVAQLDETSRETVLGECGEIQFCAFEFRDWKVATGLAVWDFVIHRTDGTGICLHPEWKKNRIPCREWSPQSWEPPETEEVNGRRRFKDYRVNLGKFELKFESTRRTPKPAAVAEATAAVAEAAAAVSEAVAAVAEPTIPPPKPAAVAEATAAVAQAAAAVSEAVAAVAEPTLSSFHSLD